MPYQVNKYDGSSLTTIPDYQYDDTSTTITLFGKGVTNYGQPMADNLVNILENFAAATPPGLPAQLGTPLVGQLWYDTVNRKLRVRSPTTNWDIVGAANVGATPPSPANAGDIWLDTSTTPAKTRIYNGTAWQLIGSSAAAASSSSGTQSINVTGDSTTYFTSTDIGANAAPQIGDLWWDYATKQFNIYDNSTPGTTGWVWQGPVMDSAFSTFISPEGLNYTSTNFTTNPNKQVIISSNPTKPNSKDGMIHFVCDGYEQATITLGSLQLPSGPTNQRPGTGGTWPNGNPTTISPGMIRYNNQQNRFEGVITNGPNDVWAGLGGVIDVNQDTFVSAERVRSNPWTDNADPGLNYDCIDVFTRGYHAAEFLPTGDLNLLSTGFLQLPTGTLAQRPYSTGGVGTFNNTSENNVSGLGTAANDFAVQATNGMMRYNTDTTVTPNKSQFEIFINGSWIVFKNPRPNYQGDVNFSSSVRIFFDETDLLTYVTNPVSGSTTQSALTTDMISMGITSGMKLLPINHGLQELYVNVQVYDDYRKMVIPDDIYLFDQNNLFLDVSSFLQASGSNWVLSKTGPGPADSDGYIDIASQQLTATQQASGKSANNQWCIVISK